MPGIESLAAFLLASVLLCLAPGPDNLYVLSVSALQGWRKGLWVTLGLVSGLWFHTLLVILGVAALLQTSMLAFTLLKMIGAAYLGYLAWQCFRGLAKQQPLVQGQLGSVSLSARQLYRRGVFMNISNPKVTLFFLAFVPQFVSLDSPAVPQLLLLAGLFMLLALLIFLAIALLAASLSGWLRESAYCQRVLQASTGVVFAGLALRLLAEPLPAS